MEPWIPHAVTIAIDVKAASGTLGAVCGITTERTDDRAEFAVVQFRATRGRPLFGLFG